MKKDTSTLDYSSYGVKIRGLAFWIWDFAPGGGGRGGSEVWSLRAKRFRP